MPKAAPIVPKAVAFSILGCYDGEMSNAQKRAHYGMARLVAIIAVVLIFCIAAWVFAAGRSCEQVQNLKSADAIKLSGC